MWDFSFISVFLNQYDTFKSISCVCLGIKGSHWTFLYSHPLLCFAVVIFGFCFGGFCLFDDQLLFCQGILVFFYEVWLMHLSYMWYFLFCLLRVNFGRNDGKLCISESFRHQFMSVSVSEKCFLEKQQVLPIILLLIPEEMLLCN